MVGIRSKVTGFPLVIWILRRAENNNGQPLKVPPRPYMLNNYPAVTRHFVVQYNQPRHWKPPAVCVLPLRLKIPDCVLWTFCSVNGIIKSPPAKSHLHKRG